jgi:hypothetical protein
VNGDNAPPALAITEPEREPVAFDMLAHLARQREWSGNTFGPGPRTEGVIDHIRKELREIEADPSDITEWIDVVILALDGAWRAGFQPQEIIDAMVAKQTRNEGRNWPDWRTMPADKAIEHDRSGETLASPPAQEAVTDAQVELAAEVIWNDIYGARAGAWDNPPANSVSGIQIRATARAALTAAATQGKEGQP